MPMVITLQLLVFDEDDRERSQSVFLWLRETGIAEAIRVWTNDENAILESATSRFICVLTDRALNNAGFVERLVQPSKQDRVRFLRLDSISEVRILSRLGKATRKVLAGKLGPDLSKSVNASSWNAIENSPAGRALKDQIWKPEVPEKTGDGGLTQPRNTRKFRRRTIVLSGLAISASASGAYLLASQKPVAPGGIGVRARDGAPRIVPSIALLIGINKYAAPLRTLVNPENDVRLIAGALNELQFRDPATLVNPTRDEILDAAYEFGKKAGRLEPGAAALFYFAGHGLQFNGGNYLMAADSAIVDRLATAQTSEEVEAVLRSAFVPLQELVSIIATGLGKAEFIFIIDACRDNPLPALLGSRSRGGGGKRGLAEMKIPTRVLLAYSTLPGETSEDGEDKPNSPYATALASQLIRDNAIPDIFGQVRVLTEEATSGDQTPQEYTTLGPKKILLGKPSG